MTSLLSLSWQLSRSLPGENPTLDRDEGHSVPRLNRHLASEGVEDEKHGEKPEVEGVAVGRAGTLGLAFGCRSDSDVSGHVGLAEAKSHTDSVEEVAT